MPRIEKYITGEVILRVLAIVLELIVVLLASVCISGLTLYYHEVFTIARLAGSEYHVNVNARAISGFIIFLALLEVIFQIVAIVWLFADVAFLNIKIPLGRTMWYLFNVIKLLFHLGLITGYLALSIPMAVFSGYSIHDIDTLFKALKANSFGLITVHVPEVYVRSGISAIFLTFFCWAAILHSVIMVVFILVAKFKYKLPKYDPSSDQGVLHHGIIMEHQQ